MKSMEYHVAFASNWLKSSAAAFCARGDAVSATAIGWPSVTTDGIDWTTIWENPEQTIAESAWTLVSYDISPQAAGRPAFINLHTAGGLGHGLGNLLNRAGPRMIAGAAYNDVSGVEDQRHCSVGGEDAIAVEPFQEQIVDVHERVCHAIRDTSVVSEMRKARHARHGETNHIECVTGDMMLGIHVGDFEHPMRIARQHRSAGCAVRRDAVQPKSNCAALKRQQRNRRRH